MKVVFSDRAYAGILAETTEKVKTETGGLFLGTAVEDTWYVIEAIDPGPKSIFEVAYFEYDQQYTQHLINKIANLYDRKLSLIGLWHRHPGSFDHFSSTDDGTNAKYARLNEQGAISALVNLDPRFRLTVYQVDRPCRYSVIEYQVGDELIPAEMLRLKTPERFLKMMDAGMHSAGRSAGTYGYRRAKSFRSFLSLALPELESADAADLEKEGPYDLAAATDHILEVLMEDLNAFSEEFGLEVSLRTDGREIVVYQDAIDGMVELRFDWLESKQTVVLREGETCYRYQSGALRDAFHAAVKRQEERRAAEGPRLSPSSGGILTTLWNTRRAHRNEGDSWK